MLKVEPGKIVIFTQQMMSLAHGNWGTFERTIRYPEFIPAVFIEEFLNKPVHTKMTIQRNELSNFEHDPALIFPISKSLMSGVKNIEPGMIFTTQFVDRKLQGCVKEVFEDHVIIDCNFPEIGVKNLYHIINISNIREQTKEEALSDFKPMLKVV